MAVRLSNLRPATFEPLLPAPSIHDDFVPPSTPTNRGLEDGPLRIVSDYRGNALYLENGAYVYRSSPKSPGGNGMFSIPTWNGAEAEECWLEYDGKIWEGTINFM